MEQGYVSVDGHVLFADGLQRVRGSALQTPLADMPGIHSEALLWDLLHCRDDFITENGVATYLNGRDAANLMAEHCAGQLTDQECATLHTEWQRRKILQRAAASDKDESVRKAEAQILRRQLVRADYIEGSPLKLQPRDVIERAYTPEVPNVVVSQPRPHPTAPLNASGLHTTGQALFKARDLSQVTPELRTIAAKVMVWMQTQAEKDTLRYVERAQQVSLLGRAAATCDSFLVECQRAKTLDDLALWAMLLIRRTPHAWPYGRNVLPPLA